MKTKEIESSEGHSNPPLLPPLHPSPAVLLHIKYLPPLLKVFLELPTFVSKSICPVFGITCCAPAYQVSKTVLRQQFAPHCNVLQVRDGVCVWGDVHHGRDDCHGDGHVASSSFHPLCSLALPRLSPWRAGGHHHHHHHHHHQTFPLGEQESLEEDPVLIFPNHSSFVVRWDPDNLVDKYDITHRYFDNLDNLVDKYSLILLCQDAPPVLLHWRGE